MTNTNIPKITLEEAVAWLKQAVAIFGKDHIPSDFFPPEVKEALYLYGLLQTGN